MARKPILLIILDGWGIREAEHGNAVVQAETPNFDRWLRACERSIVHTSGEHVGLTPGQMGNSEVGHLNLGAGRIVYQDISRIANAIADGSLADNPVLRDALQGLRQAGKKLHLIGLLGDGGVHSHSDHLYALLEIAAEGGLDPVLHLITDGRDTPTRNGIKPIAPSLLDKDTASDGVGRIVDGQRALLCDGPRSSAGSERSRAYDAMALRASDETERPRHSTAIRQSYEKGVTDEFIVAYSNRRTAMRTWASAPGDALLCMNFRADRMRQLAQAFVKRDYRSALERFRPIAGLDAGSR